MKNPFRKATQEEPPTEEPPTEEPTTKEILIAQGQKLLVDDNSTIQVWKHREQLAKTTGLNIHNSGLTVEVIQKLYDHSYIWIIDRIFIERFKYAATVRSLPGEISPVVWSDRLPDPIIYVGDIPDNVLNRIEEGISLGLKYFTVHSSQPLPVKQIYTDPILIGWVTNPHITMQFASRGLINWEAAKCRTICWGVVIGIWDADKEIDVL